MRSMVVMTLSLAALAPPASSWASSAMCAGRMRPAGCQDPGPDVVWPGDRAPVFSASCNYCPSPNDAGYVCMRQPPHPSRLTLYVGGRAYRNDVVSGTPPYFEAIAGSCGEEGMFRYTGPLAPGMSHTIDLGGYGYPGQQPIVFFVAPPPAAAELSPELPPEPPPDAGRDSAADAAEDAAPPDVPPASADAGGKPRDPAGCACSTARPSRGAREMTAGLALVVAGVSLMVRRRLRA